MIDSPESADDTPPRKSSEPFTEEEELIAAQLYLEHLYMQAFNEAALYGEAIRAVRRVGIVTRSRQKEIAELERWYALDESHGGESADNRPDDDPGAPA